MDLERRIEHYSSLDGCGHEALILDLLNDCKDDFVPSLDTRSSATDLDFSETEDSGVVSYFLSLMSQPLFITFNGRGDVVGMLSYDRDHILPYEQGEATYVSTLLISPKNRNGGLAERLYKELMLLEKDTPIALRTWGSNRSHLHLLEKLGFECTLRIKNDRGTGIDTVYYRK